MHLTEGKLNLNSMTYFNDIFSTTKYSLFLSSHENFSKIGHKLSPKTSHNIIQVIGIIQNIVNRKEKLSEK